MDIYGSDGKLLFRGAREYSECKRAEFHAAEIARRMPAARINAAPAVATPDRAKVPNGKPGGKPAIFHWPLLRDLTPGSDESLLVPTGIYKSLRATAQAGRRAARRSGMDVRLSIRANGVRFWRTK